MNKKREVETLKHKISEIDEMMNKFIKNKINNKKVGELKMMRLQYEDQLEGYGVV